VLLLLPRLLLLQPWVVFMATWFSLHRHVCITWSTVSSCLFLLLLLLLPLRLPLPLPLLQPWVVHVATACA
jgi:hypothetical protein